MFDSEWILIIFAAEETSQLRARLWIPQQISSLRNQSEYVLAILDNFLACVFVQLIMQEAN